MKHDTSILRRVRMGSNGEYRTTRQKGLRNRDRTGVSTYSRMGKGAYAERVIKPELLVISNPPKAPSTKGQASYMHSERERIRVKVQLPVPGMRNSNDDPSVGTT